MFPTASQLAEAAKKEGLVMCRFSVMVVKPDGQRVEINSDEPKTLDELIEHAKTIKERHDPETMVCPKCDYRTSALAVRLAKADFKCRCGKATLSDYLTITS